MRRPVVVIRDNEPLTIEETGVCWTIQNVSRQSQEYYDNSFVKISQTDSSRTYRALKYWRPTKRVVFDYTIHSDNSDELLQTTQELKDGIWIKVGRHPAKPQFEMKCESDYENSRNDGDDGWIGELITFVRPVSLVPGHSPTV